MTSDDGRPARISTNTESTAFIQTAVYATVGPSGRMLSKSKTRYVDRHPRHVVVFNANVCIAPSTKIWHGDLDLTVDEPLLLKLARSLQRTVHVLFESDGRFENERRPLIDNAVYWVAPTGQTNIPYSRLERTRDGLLLQRAVAKVPAKTRRKETPMRTLDLSWASIEEGRAIDWAKAEAAIAALADSDKRRLGDAGDTCDGWTIDELRNELTAALAALKEVVKSGRHGAGMLLTGPTPLRVYVVDGEVDRDLYDQFQLLRFSGVLIPAGFSDDR